MRAAATTGSIHTHRDRRASCVVKAREMRTTAVPLIILLASSACGLTPGKVDFERLPRQINSFLAGETPSQELQLALRLLRQRTHWDPNVFRRMDMSLMDGLDEQQQRAV